VPTPRNPENAASASGGEPPRGSQRLADLVNQQPADTSGVVTVLDTWGRLLRHAPDRGKAVGHYTNRSGIAYADINHLRLVRNACAHPEEGGWPSTQALNRALVTAHALRELTVGLKLS
jgi:hypothetical protein